MMEDPSIAVPPPNDFGDEAEIQDFLQILEEHRKNCEKQGKYVEAEIAKTRLLELRAHEENRRREAMRSRQIAERLGVEEAHMLEFQQFNNLWDKKMMEYELKAQELVQAMKERHAAEMGEFQEQLRTKPEYSPKFSKELLNLRKIQETLAKQKEYSDAHKIKMKADNLESWELEKLRAQKDQKIANLLAKFQSKQTQELAALYKRVQSGREEQKKQRQLDLERLLQRYQNVKSELEAQHNIERLREEKYFGASFLGSTMANFNQSTGGSTQRSKGQQNAQQYQQNNSRGNEADGQKRSDMFQPGNDAYSSGDPLDNLDHMLQEINTVSTRLELEGLEDGDPGQEQDATY